MTLVKEQPMMNGMINVMCSFVTALRTADDEQCLYYRIFIHNCMFIVQLNVLIGIIFIGLRS